MSTHIWDQKSTYSRKESLLLAFDIGMQRYLMPFYAKAFAMYAGERLNMEGVRAPSEEDKFRYLVARVKISTLRKYSQYNDKFDELVGNLWKT